MARRGGACRLLQDERMFLFFLVWGHSHVGRAKRVAGMPIATRFLTLFYVPIFPLKSFYFRRAVAREQQASVGIWFSEEAIGVPLARLDWISVLAGYLRGALRALAVFFGTMAAILLVVHFGDHRRAQADAVVFLMALVPLAVVAAGGLLTYAIPLTSRRERHIRERCAELLQVSADPARLPANLAAALLRGAAAPVTGDAARGSRIELLRRLVAARARIALASDAAQAERETDLLLDQLARTI
jgi:hypothetical protein